MRVCVCVCVLCVGASTFHSPVTLHGFYRDSFTFFTIGHNTFQRVYISLDSSHLFTAENEISLLVTLTHLTLNVIVI
jgi:hypothetical protein